jgi:hypothetical protein
VPRQRQYYTLISSLPALPRFERAERLPINEVRLVERLRMLDPDDRIVVERTASFLAWQRQPVERTDAEVVAFFRQMTDWTSSYPVLRQMIEYRMELRTVMAALRRRHRGLPAPAPAEAWGVGPWVSYIERHWEEADFRLAAIFPWIPQARQHLVAGETLALERLLMGLIWDRVDLLSPDMFAFARLLAYLFKWDILRRWLACNRETAQTRFETLVMEVIGEHDQLFNGRL